MLACGAAGAAAAWTVAAPDDPEDAPEEAAAGVDPGLVAEGTGSSGGGALVPALLMVAASQAWMRYADDELH